jgi:hypothetical protein
VCLQPQRPRPEKRPEKLAHLQPTLRANAADLTIFERIARPVGALRRRGAQTRHGVSAWPRLFWMRRVDEFGHVLVDGKPAAQWRDHGHRTGQREPEHAHRTRPTGRRISCCQPSMPFRKRNVTHVAADDEQRVLQARVPGINEALGFSPTSRQKLAPAVGLRASISSARVARREWRLTSV